MVYDGTVANSGDVFKKADIDMSDFFTNMNRQPNKPYGPIETDMMKYNFDDVMWGKGICINIL